MRAVDVWAAAHRADPWELEAVVREVADFRPLAVLEIGSHVGHSLRVWREELDPDLLVSVQDTDELSRETADELWARAIRGRSQDPAVRAEVLELLDGSGAAGFALVYVDGSHSLLDAAEDWAAYSPLAAPWGVVAMDDAGLEGNPTCEVREVWDAVRRGRRHLLAMGRGTGVGIARP